MLISVLSEVDISGISCSQGFSYSGLANTWDRHLFAVWFIRSVLLPLGLKIQE